MALFHERQQKETLSCGMCFTQELFSSWMVALLFPHFLPPSHRGYYQEWSYDALSLDTLQKQSRRCTGHFARTRPAVWRFSGEAARDTRCNHIALFLFELTSNISQRVFRVMPAMWMAYANIAVGLAGYHRFCVCAYLCGDQ